MKRPSSVRSRRSRKAALHGTVALAAGLGLALAVPGTARADTQIRLDYPLTGTTHLRGPGSDLALGLGTLKADANITSGALTAETVLPDAPGKFTLLGLPVTVTTEFIEEEPTTGTIDTATGAVETTSHLTLKLKDLKIAGVPAPVGDRCRTREPAKITLKSEPGFNVLAGGKLTGTYEIPKFEHCLLNTLVINGVVPAADNTITLTLGKGQVPPAE